MNIDIFKDGVLFTVHVKYWSGGVLLKAEDIGFKKEEFDEAIHSLGKNWLIPRKIRRQFKAVEARARRIVAVNAFPFPIGTAYFIPKRKLPEVLKVLEECKAAYARLVQELIANYESYKTELRPNQIRAAEIAFQKLLPSLSDVEGQGVIEFGEGNKEKYVADYLARLETCYPKAETLPARFSLGWTPYAVAMPEMTETDAEGLALSETERQAVAATYQKQMESVISDFKEGAVKYLRNELLKTVDRIAKNVTEGRVTKKTIDSIQNAIDNFLDMNFIGDKTVEQRLQELRTEFLDRYPAELVKDDKELQTALSQKIQVIRDAVTNTADIVEVTNQYKRKFQFD